MESHSEENCHSNYVSSDSERKKPHVQMCSEFSFKIIGIKVN